MEQRQLDGSHDFLHVERVHKLAETIAKAENKSIEDQIDDAEDESDHEAASELAFDLMDEQDW